MSRRRCPTPLQAVGDWERAGSGLCAGESKGPHRSSSVTQTWPQIQVACRAKPSNPLLDMQTGNRASERTENNSKRVDKQGESLITMSASIYEICFAHWNGARLSHGSVRGRR